MSDTPGDQPLPSDDDNEWGSSPDSPFDAPRYGDEPAYGSAPYAGAAGFGASAPLAVLPKPPALGDGLRWAWSRFTDNAGTLVGAALTWAIIMLGASLIVGTVIGAIAWGIGGDDSDFSLVAQIIMTFVLTFVLLIVMAFVVSSWLNGLVRIADGHRVEFSDFFRARAFGTIVIVSFILGVISGTLQAVFDDALDMPWLAIIFSILVSVFTIWMIYLAADRDLGVADAMAGGINLSVENLGPTIVILLMSFVLTLVGVILLLVGLLVTLPVSGLLAMYYLRSLTQRPIAVDAPPAPPAY